MAPGLSPLAVRAADSVNGVKTETARASARRSYSTWLRHLRHAKDNGLNARPDAVTEIGPGDNLGHGLAALLCGASRYYAFDIVKLVDAERSLAVFDELAALFAARAAIPDDSEFPRVIPKLTCYDFPSDVLDEKRLRGALSERRLERIRDSIRAAGVGGDMISYKVPWSDSDVVEKGSVDMIFSQAAMEHVDDLRGAYSAMNLWLKPGGYMSHAIDFKAHHLSDAWNEHWTYGNLAWKLLRGKRPYLLNREPLSTHLRLLEECGFDAVCVKRTAQPPDVSRERLAARFRNMPEDDLTTSGALVQSIKRTELSQEPEQSA